MRYLGALGRNKRPPAQRHTTSNLRGQESFASHTIVIAYVPSAPAIYDIFEAIPIPVRWERYLRVGEVGSTVRVCDV